MTDTSEDNKGLQKEEIIFGIKTGIFLLSKTSYYKGGGENCTKAYGEGEELLYLQWRQLCIRSTNHASSNVQNNATKVAKVQEQDYSGTVQHKIYENVLK